MSLSLKKLTPNLMVEDVNLSIQFYKDVLGFETLTTVPDEGQFDWALVKRDNVEIMFQARASLVGEIPAFQHREIGGALTFYLEVEGIEELYASLKGQVTIVQDMHTTFYGSKEFAFQDCNGFVLTFSEAIAS